MTNPISVAEAKSRFSECLRRAESGQPLLITRHGKPVAALVPAEDLVHLARLRAAGPAGGLAGLVGRWDDGEPFVEELERTVAGRQPPRASTPLP